jgi:hypothetical protein
MRRKRGSKRVGLGNLGYLIALFVRAASHARTRMPSPSPDERLTILNDAGLPLGFAFQVRPIFPFRLVLVRRVSRLRSVRGLARLRWHEGLHYFVANFEFLPCPAAWPAQATTLPQFPRLLLCPPQPLECRLAVDSLLSEHCCRVSIKCPEELLNPRMRYV